MSLTKIELAEAMFAELRLNRREAKVFLDLLFEEIRSHLEAGREVKLSGFGNFELHHKRQRIGRNPKTGEPAKISARRVVSFRPGRKLLSQVQQVPVGD